MQQEVTWTMSTAATLPDANNLTRLLAWIDTVPVVV